MALRDLGKLMQREVRVGDQGVVAQLFIKQVPAKPPRWVSLFDGAVTPPLPTIFSAGASAVALVESQGRTFALSFGQGRHLLAAGVCEERFGLIVTLNSIPSDKLRSIDIQSFDAIPRHSRTQSSREGDVTNFDFDFEQDLLRAVTGSPADGTLGKRIDGMDALHVTMPMDLLGLKPLLAKYYEKFCDKAYQRTFPWIDQLSEVRDKSVTVKLEKLLVDRLRGGAPFDRLWLAVPTILDWKDVAGFRYNSEDDDNDVHPDLHIADFLSSRSKTSPISMAELRSGRVSCLAASSDAVLDSWPTHHCLYAELDYDGKTFLLSAGKWYAIAKEFVTAVNDSVRTLVSSSIVLPEYNDASETDYNARVANGDANLALMDCNTIMYGAGHSSVEFCDLFSLEKKLIHVKRFSGSSDLSHLFSQGEVSADLFAMADDFRAKVRAKLPVTHRGLIPVGRPTFEEFEVVFAVISSSQKDIAGSLPFFSRLNLRNRARELRARGFKVSLVKIPMHLSLRPAPARASVPSAHSVQALPGPLGGVPGHSRPAVPQPTASPPDSKTSTPVVT